MRRSDAFHKLTEIIPNELFMQYSHLDIEQLVKIPDLQPYRNDIIKVLDEWKASKDFAA